jgi:hypothetical protein
MSTDDTHRFVNSGTSVEVERSFSRAGLVISSKRNRLNPDTSKHQLLVGDWARRRELNGRAFIAAFEERTSKGKGRAENENPPAAGSKPKPKASSQVFVDLVSPEKSNAGASLSKKTL